MKTFVVAALLASAQAVKLNWPSVARCAPGQVSSDSNACDHNSKGPHPLDGTAVQLEEQWPSVARCTPGQVSTDDHACDHNSKGPHKLDGTTAVQLEEQWPSVARCTPGQVSSDSNACDHNSKGPHALDGTTFVQTEFRPPLKCKDPVHGNPITCDHDDLTPDTLAPLPKEKGLTPVKVVVGGPTVDGDAAYAAKKAAEEKAKK